MTSTQDVKEQAQQTASTATDEGKHVAGVAADEARNVAGEATAQAKGLLDEAMGQADGQSKIQRDKLVTTLHTVSDDLDSMASASNSGMAADAVRQVSQRARSLGEHLDGREMTEILDDVRSFARRRPGTFLLGALAAGVVAGRLARGAKNSHDEAPSSPAPAPAPATAGTPAPTGAPVTTGTAPTFDPLYPESDGLGTADAASSYAP